MVSGIGIKSYYFDGSDPVSFALKLKRIISEVRKKSLPCFIEFSTYRFLEHCGPFNDDNLNYRSKKEIKKWKNKDPYFNLKSILTKNKNLKNKIILLENKNLKVVQDAFKFAEDSNFPKKNSLNKNVYKF
jgi:pyruvate dehydrogenase E1 component alpha subunit